MNASAPARGAARAVVLVGATASGKTDLAVCAARECPRPVEILALDSRQLYRDLDVATGKPSTEQRGAVPHHLLDLLEAHERPQAMWYRERAVQAMQEVLARGAVPLFVGGSGFYLRAVREGFFEVDATPERLAEVRARIAEMPPDALREELRAHDPDTAALLHPNDLYRQARALEIVWASGRTATALRADFAPRPLLGAHFDVFVLDVERSVLHERIATRTAQWLGAGWREEVEGMLAHGVDRAAPALQTLGYREVLRWIEGQANRQRTEERIVVCTRRYARQQETWFRKEAHARSIGADDTLLLRQALEQAGGAP